MFSHAWPNQIAHFPATIKLHMHIMIINVVLLCIASTSLADNLFPLYPAIRKNVSFWEKVYSTYSINSAVIHDSNDLSKIYQVVSLVDKNQPAASRINKALIKLSVERYKTILRALSKGKRPSSDSERRVAALFRGAQARQQMALAADSVRSQTGQKERFYEGFIRSGAYMSTIRQIFRAEGLPVTLAYLPHVESSFNTYAYSKAGAAGMWQFTRGTGKQYMRINDAVDERSDPFIAAEAAALYLKDSYQKLKSWPLALTAYNYGTAGMVRARDAKGSYEKIFREYDQGHFGFASRNFYSEFLAAINVAQQLERTPGIRLDKPASYLEYKLPGYIHIKNIKRHFSVSEGTLKRLNPALRPPVFTGKKFISKGYRLRLPHQKNTKALIASLPRSSFSSYQMQAKIHKVRAGENLSRIAAKHGVSLSALLAANKLKYNSTIFVGQRLRIPAVSSRSSSGQKKPSLTAAGRKLISSGKDGRVTLTIKKNSPQTLTAEKNKIHRSPPQ